MPPPFLACRTFARAAIVLAALLLPALPAAAQDAPPGDIQPKIIAPLPVPADSAGFVRQIEDYLNSIRTARAGFEQTSPGMRPQKGTLTMARPGRMRLEYAPPPNILLVGDGRSVIYHDRDMDQITYLRPQDLPVYFLLGDTVDFRRSGLTAETVTQGDIIAMTVSRPGEDNLRPVTFHFRREPLELLHWSYLDEQGSQVTVRLTALAVNMPVDNSLFRFKNPRFGG